MEHIGSKLKERRLELGLTLEEMSTKTKLSIHQLSAIEEGDIQFFKDDLSYLTYFVRYYANALNVNYDDLRLDLDRTIHDYTETVSLEKIKKHEEISSNVQKRIESAKEQSKGLQKAQKTASKLDLSSLGLFAVVLLIIAGLIFVFGKVILPNLGSQDKTPPIVNRPDEEENKPEKPNVPEEKPTKPSEVLPLSVKMVEPTTFHIENWVEGQKISMGIDVKVATTLHFSVDGVEITDFGVPHSDGVYKNVQVLMDVEAADRKEVALNLFHWPGNSLMVDGKVVELAPAIRDLIGPGTVKIVFVKGESL